MKFRLFGINFFAGVLIVGGAFAVGLVLPALKPTGYARITGQASQYIRSMFRPTAADPERLKPQSTEYVDTALLPLVKRTLVLPRELGMSVGSGGGLTIVDDKIIVVDLFGTFLMVESNGSKIARLNIPPVPSNRSEYLLQKPPVRKIGAGVSVNIGFRVHDVESTKEPGGIRLFASYERYYPDLKTTALVVSTISIDERDYSARGTWQDIYEGQPLVAEWYSGAAGSGRMLLVGDELYLGVGDYNQDNVFMKSRLEAQMPDSDYGKILTINTRTKSKTVISMGHRNPEGLAKTSKGAIYATEHGPRGGDTLTKIAPGTNFGWPVVTYGTHYWSYDWPNSKLDEGAAHFDRPDFVWVPSIAASNLIEVANFHPAWDGDLLIESLKANALHRLRMDADGRVIYSEPIWMGERLRDIGSLPDGTIVMLSDAMTLIYLTVDTPKLATNTRPIIFEVGPRRDGCADCQ